MYSYHGESVSIVQDVILSSSLSVENVCTSQASYEEDFILPYMD